ncbi:hypothetical protein TNCV_171781 [Trichonephila clavipes]|nr:hypothetical protein TNCV_171781 [Trichonephila clavipes]
MPIDGGEIADISLIAGKEFRNWVVKDLDPLFQVVSAIQKRRRKILLSFPHDSVTTARLKTYKVHLDIGVHWARDQVGETDRDGRRTKDQGSRVRQRRQKNKRSREPSPIGAAEEQEIIEG